MQPTPTFSETVSYIWQNIIVKLIQFVPLLASAILIIIIGWIIAGIVARIVNRILRLLKLDKVFAHAKVDELLKSAGSKRDTIGCISHIVKWILLLVVFMAAVDTLKLPTVKIFFDKVVSYTPNVIAAVAILLIGAVLANLVDNVIEGALKAGKIGFGKTLSEVAKYAIYIFTIITALSQLGVAPEFMQVFFTGLVAMLAIAGGLAFGLGGQTAAKDFIEKVRKETNHN